MAMQAQLQQIALVAAVLAVSMCMVIVIQGEDGGFKPRAVLAQSTQEQTRTQQLWDNYWPGSRSIKARYERVKAIIEKRNKGLKQKPDWDPSGHKNLADPIRFCKESFPPTGFYDQEEFHSCLDALNVKKVNLEVGESQVATDITGAPAGRHQQDGPDSLSPGSEGWSRY